MIFCEGTMTEFWISGSVIGHRVSGHSYYVSFESQLDGWAAFIGSSLGQHAQISGNWLLTRSFSWGQAFQIYLPVLPVLVPRAVQEDGFCLFTESKPRRYQACYPIVYILPVDYTSWNHPLCQRRHLHQPSQEQQRQRQQWQQRKQKVATINTRSIMTRIPSRWTP